MNDLRIGVIGTGAIGKTHVERLTNQITGAKVVAVSDVNREAAEAVAREYDTRFYETGEELINAPDVDAVVVCSWDPTHEQYVLASIAADKYVFCEKPLAETAESCRRIVDAEMKKGKKLVQVGFMRRYDSGYRKMKRTIDDQKIGAPLMVHCCHRNAFPGPQYESKVNVTGVAIHEIDVIRWLLGEDFASAKHVQPQISRYVENGQADPQIIMLRTRGGICIDIETFMHCRYGYDIQCEIVGEDGTVKLPDPSEVITRAEGSCSFPIIEDWKDRFADAYNVEFQAWVNDVKNGRINGADAWDGYASIVTADACTKSRLSGNEEPIVLEATPEFYLK